VVKEGKNPSPDVALFGKKGKGFVKKDRKRGSLGGKNKIKARKERESERKKLLPVM